MKYPYSKFLAIFFGIFFGSASIAGEFDASSLHLDWTDPHINLNQNFYTFANNNWQKQNPIPKAYASWGVLNILEKNNLEIVKKIVEQAGEKNAVANSEIRKVGDFYFSGMDEDSINAANYKPLLPQIIEIEKINDASSLQKAIADFHLLGVEVFFNIGQMQDYKNSSKVIGVASQGGLGLPDREYYLKNTAKFRQIRASYLEHIASVLVLAGDTPEKAALAAKNILKLETRLAKVSMGRVVQRSPSEIYHYISLKNLSRITPQFNWSQYFTNLGHHEINGINLTAPDFFATFNKILQQTPLEELKNYMRWHLLNTYSPYLSQPFVDENFKMIALFTGVKEIQPRWMRVIRAEDRALGFAVGKLYVKEVFPETSKNAVQQILLQLRKTFRNDLLHLTWMSSKTKIAAIKKLDNMEARIGYPDKWRDYSELKIDRGSYVLNVMRANNFFMKNELAKIGKPVDKSQWEMTPQTVNAYYDPSNNSLNIPAGILQPPFFTIGAPAAINYGTIGYVMGHEMTHGFDDEGAQFDSKGNLKNWWSPDDAEKFHQATQCISDQYSRYKIDASTYLQGKLVTGEAVADLGGLSLAYRAFLDSPEFKTAKNIAGYTPQQQFFISSAHIWATNIRLEESRRLAIIDPHPPAIFRVNGSLANMAEFHDAFDIKNGSSMMSKRPCVIW